MTTAVGASDLSSGLTAENMATLIDDARKANQEAEMAAQELRAILNSAELPADVEASVRQAIEEAASSTLLVEQTAAEARRALDTAQQSTASNDRNIQAELASELAVLQIQNAAQDAVAAAQAAETPSDAVQASREASLAATAASLAASAATVVGANTGTDLNDLIDGAFDSAEAANRAAILVANGEAEPLEARDAAARAADAAEAVANAAEAAASSGSLEAERFSLEAARVSLDAATVARQVATASPDTFSDTSAEFVMTSRRAAELFGSQLSSMLTPEMFEAIADAEQVALLAEATGIVAGATETFEDARSLVRSASTTTRTGIDLMQNLMNRTTLSLAQDSLVVGFVASAAAITATSSAAAGGAGAASAAEDALTAAREAASSATSLSNSEVTLNSTVNAGLAASLAANNAADAALAVSQNGSDLEVQLARLAMEAAEIASRATRAAQTVASGQATTQTITEANREAREIDNEWRMFTRRVQDTVTGTSQPCTEIILDPLAILSVGSTGQVCTDLTKQAAALAVLVTAPGRRLNTETDTMRALASATASSANIAVRTADASLAKAAFFINGANVQTLSFTTMIAAVVFTLLL
ncbi:major cell-surface adhesin PAc-like [Syngnathus acus]|uniref:major cell-surface adhesin PAc-like n=1 Tax=Syngnathus acus TaxID=161584 RepID=UPI0018860F06|nr:major cell-surface adhesin PAc-like [Syngnathus acus]